MLGRGNNPGVALDRLQHDRHGLRVDRRVQGRQVVEWHSIDRRQTAAMAALLRHDNPRSAATMQLAPFARKLDRCLAGFAAAVEQVRLIAAGAGTQTLGEAEHAAIVQIEARIDQRLGLIGDSFDQRRGAVAKAIGAAGLGKVEVRAVVVVP